MKDIFIYSAGAGGREVLRLIEDINRQTIEWNVRGFVDSDRDLAGQSVDGLPVFSPNETFGNDDSYGITAVASPDLKEAIILNEIKATGKNVATLIHPTVIRSSDAEFGAGAVIFAGAHISFHVKIGAGVVVCFNSDIGHHVTLGDYSSIMPSTIINGRCSIGDHCILGSGAIIHEGVSIGRGSTVGIGTVVTKDIEQDSSVIDYRRQISMKKGLGKHYGRSSGKH